MFGNGKGGTARGERQWGNGKGGTARGAAKECGHGKILSSFLPKSEYKAPDKPKKYVHKKADTEVNARKLEQFLKDSTSLEELANTDPKHPAVAGGLQTKQKIADMDRYLLDGKPRNGGHSPLFVAVKGPERRAQEDFRRRLKDRPQRAWHLSQRKGQGRGWAWWGWSGWSGSW